MIPESLQITAIAVGILSPVVGWALLLRQNNNNRVKLDAETSNNISTIKTDMTTVKSEVKELQSKCTVIETIRINVESLHKTIGNGGFSGLKGDIQEMQVNCAGEMGSLKARVESLEKKDH